MYLVKAKNAADNEWTTIYDSSDKALCLISQPKRSSEMNQSGSFEFTIYPDSDFYDAVVPMDTFISAFEGTDENHLEETFYGRVLTCEDDFYGVKSVGCEGALSFLKDATVGRVSTDDHNSGLEDQTSPQAFLQGQLAAYNDKVEERKKLFYGGTSGITTSTALFKISDDQDFGSVLESQLIDVYGGFFKITRQQDGTHNLSYVKNYGIDAGTAQTIQIGRNILDKQKHTTGEGVFTFIRPVGKDGVRLGDGVYHGVACNSSNGRSGLYPVGTDAASFDALYARYGFIEKAKSFDDCESTQALATSCSKYVSDYGLDALDKLPMTFDVKLVDFFNANPDVKQIELGANYILTVDSEGRETGFEGYADGDPLQEGQEGLTLTVYSINREYENPENDSIAFYNATYLTAKDYSVILSSMTGSHSGYSGGSSRSGLSGFMASSEAEIKEEQAEESRKVEKRFIDDEDSIGMVVSITENGKVINAGGIWTEIVDAGNKDLLQGTLDVDLVALRSGAVITAINNNEGDETDLTIDFDRLHITGDLIVGSINASGTTLPINGERIKLGASNGSTILLSDRIDVDSDSYIRLKAKTYVNGDLSINGALKIGSKTETQGGEVGELYFRGDQYYDTVMYMGPRAGVDNILTKNILSKSNVEFSLDHAHSVTMSEETTGTNAGKVHAIIGAPVKYTQDPSNRESFFDIAASQTYLDGVAAAEKSGWNSAAAAIAYPGVASGEHLSDTIVVPDTWTATDAQGPTKNISLKLHKSDTSSADAAVTAQYSKDGTNWTKILRINVGNFYVDGWTSAYDEVSIPTTISASAVKQSGTVSVPSATVDAATDYTIGFTMSEPSATGNNNVVLRWGTGSDYTQNPVVLRMRLNDYRDRILELGQNSVEARILGENDNIVSGTLVVSPGATIRLYPATKIGSAYSKDTTNYYVDVSAGTSSNWINLTGSEIADYGFTTDDMQFSGISAYNASINYNGQNAIWIKGNDGNWGIARTLTLNAPQPTHDISCTANVSSIGTNRGSRTSAGSISKSGLEANTYLGFTISCGGTTEQFYIAVNP